MSYNPDAEPWRTAHALIAEFGDGASDEIWRHAQELVRAGHDIDAPGMTAVLRAVLALGSTRNPDAPVH